MFLYMHIIVWGVIVFAMVCSFPNHLAYNANFRKQIQMCNPILVAGPRMFVAWIGKQDGSPSHSCPIDKS